MCEMSQLALGGMARGHELLQQLLHRGIGSRTLSLPLYYILLMLLVQHASDSLYWEIAQKLGGVSI